MEQDKLLALLESVKSGTFAPEEALLRLKTAPFEDVDYAKIDHHRSLRHGVSEVIYGEGKTAMQINGIVEAMLNRGQKNIIVTRLSQEKADELTALHSMEYDQISRLAVVAKEVSETPAGLIVIAAAGTSDIPVAQEAALTAETLGNNVKRLYDVGVAGLHRLLHNLDIIMQARAVVAVAGMEGALPTVVGGLEIGRAHV